MQILVTIGSGVFGRAGVEFPTFPLTYAVAIPEVRRGVVGKASLIDPEISPTPLLIFTGEGGA